VQRARLLKLFQLLRSGVRSVSAYSLKPDRAASTPTFVHLGSDSTGVSATTYRIQRLYGMVLNLHGSSRLAILMATKRDAQRLPMGGDSAPPLCPRSSHSSRGRS
jgi:hypothetical protein